MDKDKKTLRELLTPAQRATQLECTIDPGFVHHRLIQTVIGPEAMSVIDDATVRMPALPDHLKKLRIDHIYTHVSLLWCNKNQVPSLQEWLHTRNGQVICSTERFGPCPEVYDAKRAVSPWVPPGATDVRVEMRYSTEHIYSSTLKSSLQLGKSLSVISAVRAEEGNPVVLEPLIIGSPWLEESKDKVSGFDPMWFGHDFYEHYLEDFDEFSKVSDLPLPDSPEPMRHISEKAVKKCLAKILGDADQKDWGGERSDYFTSHLHLKGRRVKGAFLLKGPARFEPMLLDHLGKRNDKIVRLSHEPADVLFVQHSHDVLPPVRETLRAFAVQPSNPRRYCVIDGRETLRLLQAYNLLEMAKELSKEGR